MLQQYNLHDMFTILFLAFLIAVIVVTRYISYGKKLSKPQREVKEHNKMHYPVLKDWQDVNNN